MRHDAVVVTVPFSVLRGVTLDATLGLPATKVRAIQELLGHSSLSTTQVYTRVESARLRAAYAKSHPRA